MSAPAVDDADGVFETAPCGYVVTDPDGVVLRVNRAFEALTGRAREEVVGRMRFSELLAAGSRIYHETHCLPLLRLQGEISEIALELRRADGEKAPVLLNSALHRDAAGRPRVIRTMAFDARERRRYEQELLAARRREHDVAAELQQSLLAGRLPEHPALDLGVAYRPAEQGLEVGGDWYDAFWLEEGARVALAVGDVVGHGLTAAASMGQLRSAARALAATSLGPGALLGALDAYARRHDVGQAATLVHAELDLARRELRYACAGHPPPVLLEPGAPARCAWDGRSLPLGLGTEDGSARACAVAALAPGSTVVLYTDGLVERRREVLDAGLARLLTCVEARRDEPAQELANDLARDLREPGDQDDVCVLVARVA